MAPATGSGRPFTTLALRSTGRSPFEGLESPDAAFAVGTFLPFLIGTGIARVPSLNATVGMPEATKRRMLRKMLITAAALLLVLGNLLTRLLRFSPDALGPPC